MKQSLLDLTGIKSERSLEYGKETAIINASIMAKSFRPIVVDVNWPTQRRA